MSTTRTTARNRPRRGSRPKPTGPAAALAENEGHPAGQAAASSVEQAVEAEAKQYIRGLIARYGDLDWRGWLSCLFQYIRYSFEARFPQYNDWRKQSPASLSYGVIDYRLAEHLQGAVDRRLGHAHDRQCRAAPPGAEEASARRDHPSRRCLLFRHVRRNAEQNVLDVVDALVAELKIARPPFFTLPGNHDYYSGGRGFYEMIARDQ